MRLLSVGFLVFAACIDVPDDELSSTEESLTVWDGYGWTEMEVASTSGSMQVQADPSGASGGKYLAANGPGYGRIFFDIHYPENGTYFLALRVIAPAGSALDVAIDGVTTRWEIPTASSWTWLHVDGPMGRARWNVQEGSHELRLTTVTPGVRIDRAVLSGWQNFLPYVKVFEAEWGSVVAPMRIASQRLPSATFAWVPNGTGSGGRLDLDIDTPAASQRYTIWGRANAPSTADNKFWITNTSGGGGGTWEPPVTSSTGWTWSQLPFTLSFDGADVLSVNQGEDGTKLDKILVTNDPNFYLTEASPPQQSTL